MASADPTASALVEPRAGLSPAAVVSARVAALSDSQVYELASLHTIRGLQAEEISKRWVNWTPADISRALRSRRVEEAIELIMADARNTAGSIITMLNLQGFEVADRYLQVAKGTARYVNDEGKAVPFSEGSQTGAMRYVLDRVLPERPVVVQQQGSVVNNTLVVSTLNDTLTTLGKISALLPGAGPAGTQAGGGSGEPSAPGMERFLRQGKEQLVKDADVPLTIDVPSA